MKRLKELPIKVPVTLTKQYLMKRARTLPSVVKFRDTQEIVGELRDWCSENDITYEDNASKNDFSHQILAIDGDNEPKYTVMFSFNSIPDATLFKLYWS